MDFETEKRDVKKKRTAENFRYNQQFENILQDEQRRPGTIKQLNASMRLAVGHYKAQRQTYIAVTGRTPKPEGNNQ